MVAVTVNNFMQSEKKQEPIVQMYNTRPYSSDNKEREKRANPYDLKPNKLFVYDNPITSNNIKAVYDNKIIGKMGLTTSNGISKTVKKPE
jgi:hypothetical protein